MITLHNIQGSSRKSGTDHQGNVYIQFEVDYFAEQQTGECADCGTEIESGWLCLDGGEEYCDAHVRYCVESERNSPELCKICLAVS